MFSRGDRSGTLDESRLIRSMSVKPISGQMSPFFIPPENIRKPEAEIGKQPVMD